MLLSWGKTSICNQFTPPSIRTLHGAVSAAALIRFRISSAVIALDDKSTPIPNMCGDTYSVPFAVFSLTISQQLQRNPRCFSVFVLHTKGTRSTSFLSHSSTRRRSVCKYLHACSPSRFNTCGQTNSESAKNSCTS